MSAVPANAGTLADDLRAIAANAQLVPHRSAAQIALLTAADELDAALKAHPTTSLTRMLRESVAASDGATVICAAQGVEEACDDIESLRAALTALLSRYVELVNCGDCGNWDPETEPSVMGARAALAKAGIPMSDRGALSVNACAYLLTVWVFLGAVGIFMMLVSDPLGARLSGLFMLALAAGQFRAVFSARPIPLAAGSAK